MHLVSYIDTQIARVTPLSVARIFGGLLPRLCSFMLIFLLYIMCIVARVHGYIIEFVPYLETYVIEPFGLVSSILLLGFQAKLALSIN